MGDIVFVFVPTCLLMLVNGWTDAPVTVATAVSSGAVKFRVAVFLSAVCNFFGGIMMCFLGNSVAVSIYQIANIDEKNDNLLPALLAAVITVVLWSLIALKLGLPTSESHALLAALSASGVAVAGFSAVNLIEWLKVAVGLALTTYPLCVLSYFVAKWVDKFLALGDSTFKKLQVLGAMMSSFAHGAQDGQKFAGVLAVALSLSRHNANGTDAVSVSLWAVVLSAGMITLGTFLGGRKIVDSIDTFAPENPRQGFSADLTSAVTLSVLSVLGIPAATTVAKTMAIVGAGRVSSKHDKGNRTQKLMYVAWGLTFPACAVLSYLLTQIVIFISSVA